jgi:hypothetical protein
MSELTLSEAIRIGAMLKPQAFGWYEQGGGTCAIGAAGDAVGGLTNVTKTRWPILDAHVMCPVEACSGNVHNVGAIVVHLNDNHQWTREQIADWVQTVESERQPADASARTDNAVAGDSRVSSGSPVRVAVSSSF